MNFRIIVPTILTFILTVQGSLVNSQIKLDDTYILSELKSLRIEHPTVVLNQIKEESGHGKSPLAIKYNNYTGMHHPVKRPTTSLGSSKSGFATYHSFRECLVDYLLWQMDRGQRGKTEEEYLRYLRRVYIKDQKYLRKFMGY